LELASCGAGALLWRPAGQRHGGPVGQRWGPRGWRWRCGGGGSGAHLSFQCIMMCRSLPWARGSGCQSFSSLWFFTSAKCVSRISAKSLIPGPHTVSICVPIAILDPLNSFLKDKEPTNYGKRTASTDFNQNNNVTLSSSGSPLLSLNCIILPSGNYCLGDF
jgi:hypothetical protein